MLDIDNNAGGPPSLAQIPWHEAWLPYVENKANTLLMWNLTQIFRQYVDGIPSWLLR